MMPKNTPNQIFQKWKIIPSIFLVVLCLSFIILSEDIKAESDTIKVGYIDYAGFIEEKNSKYVGYGVEYLEKIAEQTKWQYQYVYDTWENGMKKLENGEIDLLCTAQYTQERAEKFAYSNIPLGYESMILYVREDSDIYYEDYQAMNNCKVGLLSGSFQTDEFFKLAKEKEFSFEPVYFNTEGEIITALQNGNVNMVAVGSLSSHSDVRAVGRYGAEAFYCISSKKNEALIAKIDEALRQIKIEEPGLENELNQKYYGDSQISSSPLFTREEHEYIKNVGIINVKLMKDNTPLSYFKDGKMTGIFINYLKLLSEKSGLEFQFDTIDNAEEMEILTENIATENYLIIHTTRGVEYTEHSNGLAVSKPILTTELKYVKRKGNTYINGRDDYVLALPKEMKYLQPLIMHRSKEFRIKYYDTVEQCLEAVLNRTADISIQDSYILTYLLQKPKFFNELQECTGEPLENKMCLFASDKNELLISILNKTLKYISQEEKNKLITEEILKKPYKQQWDDILYNYRGVLAGGSLSIILVAVIYVVMVYRTANLQIEKREYEILQKKVQEDELTGIYNRTTFYEKAAEMILQTTEKMCIVIMDIANFKIVNDLYGIKSGDRLLCDMAKNLLELGKNRTFVAARFASDHFYMCMKESDFQEIQFPRRYKTFLEDMDITVSYGVYFVERQKDTPINIMCDWASIAVHDKENTQVKYIHYYDEKERNRIIEEQEIENEMEKALETRQFCAYVQPKYDIFTEKIIGGEALVRWKHPQKGMIPPGKFVGLFEKNGFIIKLDYYIWEETCRLLADLKKQGYRTLPISINVSRIHFYGKELREKLEALIEKYQLETENLELEITETLCVEDSTIIYERMQELQEAGFKIAMDDFGSGYSSLNMLKEMPLDILKMDLKFLDGGADVEKSQNILGTLINLAYSLKLKVVVEGVEKKEQVDFLRKIGGSYVQGYYYSKPVDSEIYMKMIKEQEII